MRLQKWCRAVVAVLLLGCIWQGIFGSGFWKEWHEMHFVQKRLGIYLPWDTEVLCAEDDYFAWPVEGVIYHVYQVNPEQMANILQNPVLEHWSEMPVPEHLLDLVMKKHPEQQFSCTEAFPIEGRQGYFCIKNNRDKRYINAFSQAQLQQYQVEFARTQRMQGIMGRHEITDNLVVCVLLPDSGKIFYLQEIW